MTVMKNKATLSVQRGFSLVELLVVIAVIAIIAAIAIPNIANITSQANIAKNQRNAQNIASVAAAAKAAGSTNDLSVVATTIAALQGSNVTAQNGSQTLYFGISTLSSNEVDGASTHLSPATTPGGAIVYTPQSQ